jgi:transcription initiation factor TFIID subunit 1
VDNNENLLLEECAEKLNSQDCYKTLQKLSVYREDFLLLEYMEQKPIVLNDTGMCIKACRYLYDYRALAAYKRNYFNNRI